jgi:hypothetical protein
MLKFVFLCCLIFEITVVLIAGFVTIESSVSIAYTSTPKIRLLVSGFDDVDAWDIVLEIGVPGQTLIPNVDFNIVFAGEKDSLILRLLSAKGYVVFCLLYYPFHTIFFTTV